MTATDWTAGAIVAGALWAFAFWNLRRVARQAARDRREMRRAAEDAYRGPHEA